MTSDEGSVIFRLEGVTKVFGASRRILRRRAEPLRALDDVSLEIHRGEVLGLVGESGSGKTTLGRILVGSERRTSGTVQFDGR
ncbi:MAG TPA: ATP-binding cassette domain-containing protein, partial [Kribbella sp.]